MSAELVKLEYQDAIGIVTLQRPPVNAVNAELLQALDAALDGLRHGPPARAAVLTGSGNCFSAGLDLKAMSGVSDRLRRDLVLALNATLLKLYGFPLPVVAALNGHAIAGGLVLALACDYRVATSETAQIGLTEARVGIPFPMGALAIVDTELSVNARRRLALVGHTVPASRALEWGAVDETHAADRVLLRAIEVAADLGEIPPKAFAAVKRQLRQTALDRIQATVDAGHDPVLNVWDPAESTAVTQRKLGG